MADSLGLGDAARIHVVGAGGSGMSGITKLMSQRGHVVSGSDLKPGRALDALGDLGIETWVGHAPDRIADVDLVVASSAVPERDTELAAARTAGVPVWSRPDFLDALTTVMSLVAMWLMARRHTESWVYWIGVDVIGIGLYHAKDIRFVSLLYVLLLVLAIRGLMQWSTGARASNPVQKTDRG